ncbi:MAG: putative Integrase catalytic region [Parcubacteria group bacterium Gr01-1014_70]|nr:MAG: putative Integrase catalytic region [Parcubacteria group bacterium Gr01-1014_70]
MVTEGVKIRAIAKRLGRSPNTISYELRENEVSGRYDAKKADFKARHRRKDAKFQGMKIPAHTGLKKYVDRQLLDDLSPEAIAGRVTRREKGLPSVSKNSIRRYIDSAHGAKVAWYRMQRKKKRKWRKKRPKVTQLKDRTFIDKRPGHIQKRMYVGHAEADFILSGKSGKGIILTLADRKIRVSFLEQILTVNIEEVHHAFERIKQRFPELKSISTDNDLLLAAHKELERLLDIKIYFCHPYHSWEKGSIENTNKYVRKDIPKGSDISTYSKTFIKKLEDKLNRRPMKVLNYFTPQELLDRYRNKKQRSRAVRKTKRHKN